jgi:hypothetical protein
MHFASKSPFRPPFSKGRNYKDGKGRKKSLKFIIRKHQFSVPLFEKRGQGRLLNWELCSDFLGHDTSAGSQR